MKATFTLLNTDNIEAEMRITMSLREWKQVCSLLRDGSVPAQYRFSYRIGEMVERAEQEFSTKEIKTGKDTK